MDWKKSPRTKIPEFVTVTSIVSPNCRSGAHMATSREALSKHSLGPQTSSAERLMMMDVSSLPKLLNVGILNMKLSTLPLEVQTVPGVTQASRLGLRKLAFPTADGC